MTQKLDARLAGVSSPVLSIFRVVLGLLFALHGTMKLFGWPLGEAQVTIEVKPRGDGCVVRMLEKAVRGMLPRNSLGRQMLGKLKVYAGDTHPHAAQQPVPFEISQVAQ